MPSVSDESDTGMMKRDENHIRKVRLDRLSHLFLALVALVCGGMLTGCHYTPPAFGGEGMPREQRDSLLFFWSHHITINSNFEVTADSLALCERFLVRDSSMLYRGDCIVLADFMVLPHDSIDSLWVKVAHDQNTMGWVRRGELLEAVVPVDPVSKFIHYAESVQGMLSAAGLALFLLIVVWVAVWRSRLSVSEIKGENRLFPLLLCMSVATMGVLYAGIRHYVPDTWLHFYYNPSLNPFVLPFVLTCFVGLFWMVLVISVAVIEEGLHRHSFLVAGVRLAALCALCLLEYLFFTLAPFEYVALPCWVLFFCFAWMRLRRYCRVEYRCGCCGGHLFQKGQCPHCGAMNE